MHESYWNLNQPAFENDGDASFYYPGASHEGALLKLRYVIEHRKGCALLAAPHGLGKSYLTSVLAHELDADRFPVARVVYPKLSPIELIGDLHARLGGGGGGVGVGSGDVIDTTRAGGDRVLRSLEQRLCELTSDGRHAVFIVDEAHLLDPEHLQALQLLLNLRSPPQLDFTLLLIGQPELLPRVRRAGGLDSRVAARTTLRPLSLDETRAYVLYRLGVAGAERSPFADETLAALCELSQGVPRRINQLCDLSLLIGFADELSTLGRIEIEAAAAELGCVSAD